MQYYVSLNINMKKFFLVILVTTLLSCQNSQQPLSDQTSSVVGLVKSEDGSLIDSCIVGFLVWNYDTTNIENDSLILQNAGIFNYSSNGHFRIDWFLGPVPLPYTRMFAINDGFSPWFYKNNQDTVYNLDTYLDSIHIVLRK